MSYMDIIKKKQKEWKCEKPLINSVTTVQGRKLPFTSPLLNWVTYGGIPRDKITEIYGGEGSGKSTTVLDLCKNASSLFRQEYNDKIADLQQMLTNGDKNAESKIDELQEIGPKKVVYLDIEHAFDVAWAEKLGINFEGDEADIDVIQPTNVVAEELLQFVREIASTSEIGLIAIDSVPALVPRAMLGKEIGERTVAALAGLLATFLPIIIPILTRCGCTLILVNQTRDNLVNQYVDKTPGGQAPKFYASLRAKFRKSKFVDFLGNELPNNVEDPAGCKIEMQIMKQKTAPNDRRLGTYYLMTTSGIRPDYDLAEMAINDYSLIRKNGGWYSFVDPATGELLTAPDGKPIKVNGMANVYSYFTTNPEYYEALKQYIIDDINGKRSEGEECGEEAD